MRKFHCVSLGCSENALDGSLMERYLEGNDWVPSDGPEGADLIIVNSCGFTTDAERRSLETYQDMMARKAGHARVIFAGCLPAINKKAVRAAGYEDVLVTPRRMHLLDAVTEARTPIDDIKSGCIPASGDNIGISFGGTRYAPLQKALKRAARLLDSVPSLPVPRLLMQFLYIPDGDTEFVRISVGCMNSCTFCSIPKAKGWTKSVPRAIVVERVRDALRRGKRSIAFSCDELASYGQDLETDIVALLDEVTLLPEKFDLVLRNVHPEWMLKYWHGLEPSFRRGKISQLVIPLQAGSDKVLTLMKRNHTTQEYRWLLERVRDASPRTIVRTHLVVGFPGETEDDFRTTYQFMRNLPVDSVCVHSYSERSFTPAAALPDKVPADVIRRRAEALERLDPVNRAMKLHGRVQGWMRRMGLSSSESSPRAATNEAMTKKGGKRSLPVVA